MMLILLLLLSFLSSPKESFDLAIGLYRDGVFSLAKEEFANLLTEYPDNPYREKAEYYIASSDFYLENYELACREFAEFTSNYPASNLRGEARRQLARSLFEFSRYEESISIFKSLDIPDSKYWLGECYYRLGQLDTALYYYKSVPKESRYIEYAIYSAGFIDMERDSAHLALQSFNRLVTDFPESILLDAALYYSGRIYFETGDLENARLRLSSVDGRYEEDAVLFLGHTFLKLGLYDQAEEEYRSLAPGKHREAGIMGLGDIYYLRGELDNSLAEYKKIENYTNLRDEVAVRIGRVYYLKKQFEEARNWFVKAKTPQSRLMAANTLFEMERYSEAFERYIELYHDENLEEALYRASLSSYMAGSIGDVEYLAIEYLDNGYEEHASHVHLILGELYYKREKYSEAAREYKLASKDSVNAKQGLLGLAYSYEMIGDKKNTMNTLYTLVEAYPDDNILYKAAEMAYSLKEYQTAVSWFGRVEGAQYYTGKVYFDMGNYRESIESFKGYAKKFPMSDRADEALFMIGIAERRMLNYSQSVAALDELLKLYPSTDYAYDATLTMGDNYFDMGKYDDAIKSYMDALSLQTRPIPRDAINALYGIIDAEYSARGLESSLSLASDYIKTNPHISDYIYMKMGDICYQNGEYERAIEYYDEIKSRENLPRALYWLGSLYYSLRISDKAETALTRLIQEFPGNDYALKGTIILAGIYIDRKDYPKAEAYLLKSKNDEGLLKLAQVYIKQGRYQEAEKNLIGLLEAEDRNISNAARLELADMYIERGETATSRDYLSTVLNGNDASLKPKARLLEADSYFKVEQWEEAARSYLMVNYLYGENIYISTALFKAAMCYENLQNIEEARKFYSMVIKRGDDSELVERAKSSLQNLK